MNFEDLLIALVQMSARYERSEALPPEVVLAVNALIKYIQQQSDMTVDQILERAGFTLDASQMMLLEDQARLIGFGEDAAAVDLEGDASVALDLGGDETKNKGY